MYQGEYSAVIGKTKTHSLEMEIVTRGKNEKACLGQSKTRVSANRSVVFTLVH